MDRVTVLMSTYNGEKYLRPQLDSIFHQNNVEVRLIVRDDGSTDKTVDILLEYKKEYPSMQIIQDGTKRYACLSFLSLITQFSDDEFFALADQDDIWDANKLECAIRKIKTECSSNEMVLYFSNLKIVDSKGKFYRYSHDSKRNTSNKYACLVDNQVTGCTVVYNQNLAKFVKGKMPEEFSMHDTYLFMVASLFGKVIYDFDAHISYRQHENNVIGANLKKPRKIDLFTKSVRRIFNKELQPRRINAIQFNKLFSDSLSEKDGEKIRKMATYKMSWKNKVDLLFDNEISSFSNKRTWMFKMLVLFGNA